MSCRPQIINKIEHFISRDALDISSIGSKTVEMLYDEGKINNVGDLYKLKLSDLINLNGFGSESNSYKKAQNIIDGINNSKSKSFDKLIFGLGIRYVGKTVAKKLSLKFENIVNLKNANFNSLIETDEIGEKIANSVLNFFRDEHNIRLINSLSNSGLNFALDNDSKNKSNKLNNLTFVISGTFTFSREQLANIIEQNDGKLSSSISKNTDYLIEGNKAGPKKIEKANLLGVKIITETKFLSLLND
jgi:DNA ligase (NAD+)